MAGQVRAGALVRAAESEGRIMTASSGFVVRASVALSFLTLAGVLLGQPAWAAIHLTQDEMSRLLKVVDRHGSYTTIPADVASVLKLTPAQHTPDIKQVAYEDDKGNRHGFAPLNDGSGFFLFSAGPLRRQTVFVLDTEQHLLHAARNLQSNGPLIGLPSQEAQQELDEELRRWSKVLSPEGPSMPPHTTPSTGAPVQAQPYPFKKAPDKP